jgi:pyrimidine operon attenuation protein/uracil phosphoribosyltransferase|tara:strand:+ start:2296 stop:2814 length:519 start_codon:yes stop_codon:yes gene_type:complete
MAEPLSAADLQAAVDRLASQLTTLSKEKPIALLGIANGGISLTKKLAEAIGGGIEWGTLNILFHRDDVGTKPIPADFKATDFSCAVDDAHLVLVDDVFASGRTIRAALNEIFDHGRPASITLAVLIDTARRALPIRPDYVGVEFPCNDSQQLKVTIHPTNTTAHTAELIQLS